MNCIFPDNSPRRLEDREETTCKRCGATYFVRLYPVRAECGLSDVGEFLDSTERTGLGDVVAKVISAVTLGLVKKSPGCGCEERQRTLNQWWNWKRGQQ